MESRPRWSAVQEVIELGSFSRIKTEGVCQKGKGLGTGALTDPPFEVAEPARAYVGADGQFLLGQATREPKPTQEGAEAGILKVVLFVVHSTPPAPGA